MLYDKRWDAKVETKADPFSLESLIAWLEKQPAKKTYCYVDHGRCLLGQYFTACGFGSVEVVGRLNPAGAHFVNSDGKNIPYPPLWDEIAAQGWRTFGAALARARAELVKRG